MRGVIARRLWDAARPVLRILPDHCRDLARDARCGLVTGDRASVAETAGRHQRSGRTSPNLKWPLSPCPLRGACNDAVGHKDDNKGASDVAPDNRSHHLRMI